MSKYRTLAVRSRYWKPGTDYRETITRLVRDRAQDGDVIVVSEKAIAMASGRICDESRITPSFSARLLANFWMRKVWGYFLAPVSRMSQTNIESLRSYPIIEGAAHKQLALVYAGPWQALRHGSEGGIDVSNVPHAYACIPLSSPTEVAEAIKAHIRKASGLDVDVMISDSDKTYSFYNFHMSPRQSAIKGIRCLGPVAFTAGRFLKLRSRSTPIAFTLSKNNPDRALRIAAASNIARGDGAGKTIWEMARRFGVSITGVSWEMLESVPHYPITIVRARRQ